MGKVINVTIDESIELDPKDTKNMPDYIKQNVLITITMAMQTYNCDWRDLAWSVKYYNGQPIISVKPKGEESCPVERKKENVAEREVSEND